MSLAHNVIMHKTLQLKDIMGTAQNKFFLGLKCVGCLHVRKFIFFAFDLYPSTWIDCKKLIKNS